jgi:hypothetical protein
VAGEDDLVARLSGDLARAHARVSRLAEGPTKDVLARRLIAVTNTAKHDLPAASRRLRELLSHLDAAEGGGSESRGTVGEKPER